MKKIKMIKEITDAVTSGQKVRIKRGHYEASYEYGTFTLRHWNTDILVVQISSRSVIKWDGWSASDRDALNTAADTIGIPTRWRIKDGVLETILEGVFKGAK